MSGRATLYLLLTVVAGAAAMLSFAALRDLAELCGFTSGLSWLLPVVIDAGAAAGSLVWLGARTAAEARRFARRLALGLLGLSVAANALGHGLAAYVLAPPWWVVVALSGIAPAVLGAMVHLAVLVGRPPEHDPDPAPVEVDDALPDEQPHALGGLTTWSPLPAGAWSPPYSAPSDWSPIPWTPSGWASSDWPPADETPTVELQTLSAADDPADDTPAGDGPDRVAALIAAGAGRRRLSRELGVSEYEARRLLEQARPLTDATAAGGSTTDPGQNASTPADPMTTGARS